MDGNIYYSVYIPSQLLDSENEVENVFIQKDEALKVLRGNKDGRFKGFKNKEDAVNYSQTGHVGVIQKFPDLKSPSATAEKAAFHAPSKQERINFRKAIEEGDYVKVKQIIWENPRYLVNVGDTPTSLKDGYRYNALHICAIHKRAEIANLILQTINTIDFVELLHGKKNSKICQEVCKILLDYYLNMPEKGRSETPLHLAVKYGAVEVVEVLTTYPQCKMIPNLENLLPKDIICDRINDASNTLKEKIANLLEERFYVPVIRSLDGTVPPRVGHPFSPTNPPELNVDPLSPEVEIQAFAGPMSKEQANSFRRRWKTPPRTANHSPSRSSLAICRSPHKSKVSASTPRKLFNTPIKICPQPAARSLFINDVDDNTIIEDTQNGNTLHLNNIKLLNEIENNFGDENDSKNNNGTNLIKHPKIQSNIGLINKTPELNRALQFNNVFALTPLLKKNPAKKDMFYTYREKIDSPIMIDKFNDSNNSDNLINNSTVIESPLALKELHVKLTDTEKGLEMIGRELAKEQNIEWKEYWDFLDTFVDIASPDGLDKLEQHLNHRKKKLDEDVTIPDVVNVKQNEKIARNEKELLHLCNELHKLGLIKDKNNINTANKNHLNTNNLINSTDIAMSSSSNNSLPISNLNATKTTSTPNSNQQTTTPYLCVEKSLQVFAKRCTKTILHNIKNIVSINDAFLSELKRLKSLICSFKDDTRFLDVDFTYVHSRFANLIVSYLKNSQDADTDTLFEIQQCFQQIIQSRMKVIDKNLHNLILVGDKKEQLQCVAEFILKFLIDTGAKILPENLKTEKICAETWSNEYACDCQWETVLSRQASRKKRYDSHNEAGKKNIPEIIVSNGASTDDKKIASNTDSINKEDWRKHKNDSSSSDNSSENDINDSDDDVFYSDFGSDEENDYNFYTPPESPTMLELDVSDIQDYNVYLLGNEPTKRDLDVLNAIFHIDIDKERHPNIYLWRAAILKHPNDERDNFPSPSVIVKKHNSFRENRSNNLIGKRLFAPSKLTLSSSPTKNHLTKFVNENFIRQNNNLSNSSSNGSNSSDLNISSIDASPTSSTEGSTLVEKNLSFMNISEC